jgi:hypothetical protein
MGPSNLAVYQSIRFSVGLGGSDVEGLFSWFFFRITNLLFLEGAKPVTPTSIASPPSRLFLLKRYRIQTPSAG